MKNKTLIIIGVVIVFLSICVVASGAWFLIRVNSREEITPPTLVFATSTPTMDLFPQVFTETPQITAAPMETETPRPTFTNIPTITPVPSNTPVTVVILPSSTPLPTTTATVAPCDIALLVNDVTIPNGSLMMPNTKFDKVWRIKNTGACTWTDQYKLVHTNGKPMTQLTQVALPKAVKPGETLDITISLSSPNDPGNYQSNWSLVNTSGKTFGIGKGTDPLTMSIRVVEPTNYTYDFALNTCFAKWTNSQNQTIPCTANTPSANGSSIVLDNPNMEIGKEDQWALWVHPNHVEGGSITATYPVYTIQDGDHFRSWIGCMANSDGCNLTFRLGYLNEKGILKPISEWNERFDGQMQKIDVNLSAYAGKKVQFVLSVTVENRKYDLANGFWFVPHIKTVLTPAMTTTPTPTVTDVPTETPTITPTEP